MKKNLVVIGIIVVVLVVGCVFYMNSRDNEDGLIDGRGGDWELPDVVGDGSSGGLEPAVVPAYPRATVGDSYKEDGMTHTEYETTVGVTAKQVLDYYENNLTLEGWQLTTRDKSDSGLEMLSEDGSQLRVSIFFTGYGDQGVVYFVDNRVQGGAAWPAMPVQ